MIVSKIDEDQWSIIDWCFRVCPSVDVLYCENLYAMMMISDRWSIDVFEFALRIVFSPSIDVFPFDWCFPFLLMFPPSMDVFEFASCYVVKIFSRNWREQSINKHTCFWISSHYHAYPQVLHHLQPITELVLYLGLDINETVVFPAASFCLADILGSALLDVYVPR